MRAGHVQTIIFEFFFSSFLCCAMHCGGWYRLVTVGNGRMRWQVAAEAAGEANFISGPLPLTIECVLLL